MRIDVLSLQEALNNDKDFLKKKVREYFLENSHQLVLEMNPKVYIIQFICREQRVFLITC